MRVRLVTAAVLAVGCATLSACASPAYPYTAPPKASPSPKPVTAPRPPARVVGVYNNNVPKSYKFVKKFAKAVGVHRSRHELFARARLAGHEHGRIGGRRVRDAFVGGEHAPAAPDEPAGRPRLGERRARKG